MHLKNNNRNFLNHLIKLETFKPIIELTIKESYRDTLVSSSCQEFFEFMRRVGFARLVFRALILTPIQENMKDFIAHVITTYEDRVKLLSESRFCGQCFRGFIRRYEMNIHPPPEAEEKALPRSASVLRRTILSNDFQANRPRCGASISPRSPTSTPTTKRTTTLPVHIPHRPPHSHSHHSTLPPSPASNSHKNADGNGRLASHCVPVAAPSVPSACQHQQRPSTSHAPHPSTRSSTIETTTNHPRIPKTRSSSPSSSHRRPPPVLSFPPPPPPPHPQSRRRRRRQQIPARVVEDSCPCGRRNAGVRRRTRMSQVSSGWSAANRDVLPGWRRRRLQVGRKPRNASGYDLVQPVWRRRRRPRCPRRHAQNQVRRTGTQDKTLSSFVYRPVLPYTHVPL